MRKEEGEVNYKNDDMNNLGGVHVHYKQRSQAVKGIFCASSRGHMELKMAGEQIFSEGVVVKG